VAQPISPDYFMHLKAATDPHLTADGSRLAFGLSWIDPDTCRTRSQIMVAETPVGRPRQFTSGADASSPRWSPDAATLAFLRDDAEGRGQIWLIPADGGEGHPLTEAGQGVIEYAWSPDGKRIAFIAEVDEAAVDGVSRSEPQPRVVRRIRYRDEGVGWRGDSRRHLFAADASTGEITQLTEGDYEHHTPVWSPDGTRIAFISARSPDRDISARNEVYVLPAGGGTPELRSEGLFMIGGIAWSPDGGKLAVVGAEPAVDVGGYGLICQGWLYVLEPGRPPRRITDDSVRPLVGTNIDDGNPPLLWTAGDTLLFAADARARSCLCSAPATGGEVRRIAGLGAITDWATDAAGTRAVVAASTLESAGELHLVDIASGEEMRITGFNDAYFADHPPARMEKLAFERAGQEIEALVWLPPDFDPAAAYPLMLDIHGGPHSVFHEAFYPLHQMGATNGYVVLAPNPRGSSSYGFEFAAAVHRDWAGEDYADIMAAVDEILKRPYLDPERIVVHGSSYGGYMSAWTVGHTDRFKAAVIAAPVTALASFYGTSDIGVHFGEAQFGGRPDEIRDWCTEHSPLTHAGNVNTPVLLIHGESDDRVPIGQSEQFYVALKRLGKTVEFVRLPGAGHSLFRMAPPPMRREYFARMLAWFERWLAAPMTDGRLNT